MIYYKIDLYFKPKNPQKYFGSEWKKNQWLTPSQGTIIIKYQVKQKSLQKCLDKLKTRMKDTKDLEFIKYVSGSRVKT